MAPPTTPAARRFVLAQSKPWSSRNQIQPSEQETKKSVSLRGDAQDQFAPPPRFQKRPSSSKSTSAGDRPSKSTDESLATPQELQNQQLQSENDFDVTSAEAAEEDSEKEAMLLDQPSATSNTEQFATELLLSPKRPLEHDQDDTPFSGDITTTYTSFKRPLRASTAFRATNPSQTPRRRFTPFATSTPARSSHSVTSSKLPFLAPPPSTQSDTSHIPLPEAFSPHRRGPKYVTGGMAATLQQWVLEAGQSALQTRRAQIRGTEETFLTELVVSQILSQSQGHLTMIAGSTGDGDFINILLIRDDLTADRAGTTKGGNTIRRGQLLGLREPCFTVQACDRQWQVCVDWKVIGP